MEEPLYIYKKEKLPPTSARSLINKFLMYGLSSEPPGKELMIFGWDQNIDNAQEIIDAIKLYPSVRAILQKDYVPESMKKLFEEGKVEIRVIEDLGKNYIKLVDDNYSGRLVILSLDKTPISKAKKIELSIYYNNILLGSLYQFQFNKLFNQAQPLEE
jgi:hypothetical protein